MCTANDATNGVKDIAGNTCVANTGIKIKAPPGACTEKSTETENCTASDNTAGTVAKVGGGFCAATTDLKYKAAGVLPAFAASNFYTD